MKHFLCASCDVYNRISFLYYFIKLSFSLDTAKSIIPKQTRFSSFPTSAKCLGGRESARIPWRTHERSRRGCVVAPGPVLERYARSKGPSPNRRNSAIGAGPHAPGE